MPRARVWCVHVWKPDVVYIQGPGLLLCFFFVVVLFVIEGVSCVCVGLQARGSVGCL